MAGRSRRGSARGGGHRYPRSARVGETLREIIAEELVRIDDERLSLLAVVAVLLLGLWRTSVWWRRARAAVFDAAARGEDVPVRIRRRAWDLAPA